MMKGIWMNGDPTPQAIIDHYLQLGRIVGIHCVMARDGVVQYDFAGGFADREARVPVTKGTLFRWASLTKAVTVATAFRVLARHNISIDTNVAEFLPWFRPALRDGSHPDITLWQLMNHTAGLSYGFNQPQNIPYRDFKISDGVDVSVPSLHENLRRLAKAPLFFSPGENWRYSLANDVIGAVLELLEDTTLDKIVDQEVCAVLGMKNSGFYVDQGDNLVTAYKDALKPGFSPSRMQLEEAIDLKGAGTIIFNPERPYRKDIYASGGGGMIGTAHDYLRFLEAVRTKDNRVIDSFAHQHMTQDSIPYIPRIFTGPGMGFGAGFSVVRDPQIASTPRSKGSYGWGGVYGSTAFIDSAHKISVVMLTNTAVEGMNGRFVADFIHSVYNML